MSKYFLPAPRVDNENRSKKGASSVNFTHSQDALIPGTRREAPLFLGVNNHTSQ